MNRNDKKKEMTNGCGIFQQKEKLVMKNYVMRKRNVVESGR